MHSNFDIYCQEEENGFLSICWVIHKHNDVRLAYDDYLSYYFLLKGCKQRIPDLLFSGDRGVDFLPFCKEDHKRCFSVI